MGSASTATPRPDQDVSTSPACCFRSRSALPPALRPDWAARTAALLAPGGVLYTLQFPLGASVETGPPFGVSREAYAEVRVHRCLPSLYDYTAARVHTLAAEVKSASACVICDWIDPRVGSVERQRRSLSESTHATDASVRCLRAGAVRGWDGGGVVGTSASAPRPQGARRKGGHRRMGEEGRRRAATSAEHGGSSVARLLSPAACAAVSGRGGWQGGRGGGALMKAMTLARRPWASRQRGGSQRRSQGGKGQGARLGGANAILLD